MYDALGRLVNERDPRGNATHSIYDKRHRPTTTMAPHGAITSFVYDAAGQLKDLIDPEGRKTSYTYDKAGRLTELRLPGQTATPILYKYDTASNLRFVHDQLNHTTEYQYDKLLRLTKEIDANGDDVEYTYYKDGQIHTLTDGEDNTTTWTYDLAGRVVTETSTFPLSDARSYKYDEFNRVVELTDRNERVTKYEYDNLHRVTFERWHANAQDPSPDHTITFDYDRAGQLESVNDASAKYIYGYDDLGRTTSITNDLVDVTPDVVLTQAFDANSNRTKLSTKIGATDDFVNNYTFDALDRMTRVTQVDVPGGNTVADKRVDFSYLRDGRFSAITRYEDLVGAEFVGQSHFDYDNTGRLKVLRHRSGTTTFADYGFTYDAANRLKDFINVQFPGESVTYTYDNRGQVTKADYTTQTDETYTFDDNGNRNNGGFIPTINNRLAEDVNYWYAYDDEGNIVQRTKKNDNSYTLYAWDHRNRLTSVTDRTSSHTQTQQVTLSYDAFNRLVKRTQQGITGSPITTGYFVYDGDQMVLEMNANGTVTHRMLWGPAVDQALADEAGSGGEVYWYFTDHLGSVRDVATYNTSTNITTIANHIAFDSFGRRASETNSALGDFALGFTGRWFDRATGLQWNLNRWYNPSIQRWMSEDPIGFAGQDPNLNRYVGNGPTMYVDPDGLQKKLHEIMKEINQENGLYQRPAEAAGSIGPVMETTGILIVETNPVTGPLLSECRIITGYDPLRDERVSNAARTGEALFAIGAGTVAAILGRLKGGALARAGREAEDTVSGWTGIPVNRGPGLDIVPGTGVGGYRIPDLRVFGDGGSVAVRGSIVEVKDTTRLYCSKQIEDLLRYTSSNNLKLELYTNATTVSSILREYEKAGRLIIHPIPK
jgi:RHS repeat-associated protein